jgi:hypothetical protein
VPNAQSDGFFSSLARKVGIGGSDTTATTQPGPAAPAKPKVIEAKRSEPPKAAVAAAKPEANKPEAKQAVAHPPQKPAPAASTSTSSTSTSSTLAAAPAANTGLVAGSAPIVPPNSFDSRFSATR